jgi:hypothetical protein
MALLKPVRIVKRKRDWEGVGKVQDRVHAQVPPHQKRPQAQEEIAPLVTVDRTRHGSRHPGC